MDTHWIRKTALLGLGLSATLALAMAGCGGANGNKDDGVLVIGPRCERELEGGASSPHRRREPLDGSVYAEHERQHGRRPHPPPSRPRGGGRSRERSSSAALRRNPRSSKPRARPQKDPEYLRQERADHVRAARRGLGHQGSQERLRLPPSPHRGQRGGQEGGRVGQARVRPEGLHLHPPCLGRDGGRDRHVKSSDPTNHNVNFQLRNLTENPVLAPGPSMEITPLRRSGPRGW